MIKHKWSRRSALGILLGGIALPVVMRSAGFAANRNATSRGLVIPGVDACLYTRAEPRRKRDAMLPWLDAWLVEIADDTVIEAIPAAFRAAYADAVAESRTRNLVEIEDIAIDSYGDAAWASRGTYIDPDDTTELGVWAAITVHLDRAVVTLCTESAASPIADLETIVTSILGRRQEVPTALLPISADLPDGMRIVDRAIQMILGDD